MSRRTRDLVDFLTARIDEDEDKARRTRFGAMDRPWVLVLGPRTKALNGDFPPDHLSIPGRRVLAECESRRLIVALGANYDESGIGQAVAEELLGALALPYSGHPDFDPSWGVSGD